MDDVEATTEEPDSGDQVDKVTSEVNNFLVLEKYLKPLHNPANVVAKLHFTLPKGGNTFLTHLPLEQQESLEVKLKVDADGDIEVPRLKHSSDSERNSDNIGDKALSEGTILIEYMNSTTLDKVGHQIWRGAFVLSDFILANAHEYFVGKYVLEMGSGTGFSGIVASLVASEVTITDIDDSNILGLIEANLKHNKAQIHSKVNLAPLDFLNTDWSTEIEKLVADADVIFAADVVYHDRITKGFVRTLQRCFRTGNKPKTVFIALEKRYVFTLSDLDVVAPAYDYFVDQMEIVFGLRLDAIGAEENVTCPTSLSNKLTVKNIDLVEYPIFFNYEPSRDLVLWKIESSSA